MSRSTYRKVGLENRLAKCIHHKGQTRLGLGFDSNWHDLRIFSCQLKCHTRVKNYSKLRKRTNSKCVVQSLTQQNLCYTARSTSEQVLRCPHPTCIEVLLNLFEVFHGQGVSMLESKDQWSFPHTEQYLCRLWERNIKGSPPGLYLFVPRLRNQVCGLIGPARRIT